MSASDALSLFYTSLSISLPTFGWVLLGLVLHRLGWLSRSLNDRISDLAFKYGLPMMLFAGSSRVDYTDMSSANYLLAGVASTLLVLGSSWLYSKKRGHPLALQGIFVQAAFRSNLAIIGLALCVAAYGESATGMAALPVAVMTVLYNILAVWVLNVSLGAETGVTRVVLGIVRNPLVLGIAAGMALSLSPLETPEFMGPANKALSAFFLPLMLVCIGASMKISGVYRADAFTWEACAWRLLVSPLTGIFLALALGVEGQALGVLFLLLATPVAISGYVMVAAARGDGVLAANITVLSTLLSIVTITLGFFLLSSLSLVGELRVQ